MVRVSKAVVIGVDPHKWINAVVVVDTRGEVLDRGTFATSTAGLRQLGTFARRFKARTWAVEGCNGVGKPLAQRLVASGEPGAGRADPADRVGAGVRRRERAQVR